MIILKNFEELGIGLDLVKGLNELGIVEPTQIQQRVIPTLMFGPTDLVAQAQTGTGKTAAYGLPLLEQIDPGMPQVQGLVLCPTRELAKQVAKQLFKFTKYSVKIFTETVCGGDKIDQQIVALRRPTHIVVATPGRLIDLLKRKAVDLSSVSTVVLDEADEMLSMGFESELNKILSFVHNIDNKWLFSATMPTGIQALITKHLSKDAERIHMSRDAVVNQKITHLYQVCKDSEKLGALLHFLKMEGENRGVVFCKTKAATKELSALLVAENVAADCIHGDLYQSERDKVMRSFKKGRLRLLVATDVAARGIDIYNLTFVAHYQLPENDEYYTHRSGRTARAGNEGVSMCFVVPSDVKVLKNYETNLGIRFKEVK